MRSSLSKQLILILIPLLAPLGLDGCGGSLGGNPEVQVSTGEGASVQFSLTDAAVDDAQNVWVQISGLEVQHEEKGWIEVPLLIDQEVDLLALRDGKSSELASRSDLPAGVYKQTRLLLAAETSARLVDAEGVSHVLEQPGSGEPGIKIMSPFTVTKGEPLAFTIDFDLRKSIKKSGGKQNPKYTLSPVLRMLKNAETGTIKGKVAASEVGSVCLFNEAALQSQNQDVTDACAAAESSAVLRNGRFHLSFIPAGRYELKIFDAAGALLGQLAVSLEAGQTLELEAP